MARHKAIENEDIMYQLFSEYKVQTKQNPFKIPDYVGKDAIMVIREKERPLTMEGFNNYVRSTGIIFGLNDYFANTKNKYRKFSNVCSRIREEIRQDQIEGGMAGMYNPSITQRLNNLVERVEQTVIEQPLFPEDEEIGIQE